jgi:hypothetical protein
VRVEDATPWLFHLVSEWHTLPWRCSLQRPPGTRDELPVKSVPLLVRRKPLPSTSAATGNISVAGCAPSAAHAASIGGGRPRARFCPAALRTAPPAHTAPSPGYLAETERPSDAVVWRPWHPPSSIEFRKWHVSGAAAARRGWEQLVSGTLFILRPSSFILSLMDTLTRPRADGRLLAFHTLPRSVSARPDALDRGGACCAPAKEYHTLARRWAHGGASSRSAPSPARSPSAGPALAGFMCHAGAIIGMPFSLEVSASSPSDLLRPGLCWTASRDGCSSSSPS